MSYGVCREQHSRCNWCMRIQGQETFDTLHFILLHCIPCMLPERSTCPGTARHCQSYSHGKGSLQQQGAICFWSLTPTLPCKWYLMLLLLVWWQLHIANTMAYRGVPPWSPLLTNVSKSDSNKRKWIQYCWSSLPRVKKKDNKVQTPGFIVEWYLLSVARMLWSKRRYLVL